MAEDYVPPQQPDLYVSSVESSIKLGLKANIGPKTVIVGPNASGKTSIVQAIMLALRHEAPEVEGRDVAKQLSVIGRLFSKYVRPGSRVKLSNGHSYTWLGIKNTDGTLSRDERCTPVCDVDLCFASMEDILRSSEDKVRTWLSQIIGLELTEEKYFELIEGRITCDADRKAYKYAWDLSEEKTLLAIGHAAKKKGTAMRREATTQEKTLDPMIQGVPQPLSPGQRESLEAERAVLASQTSSEREGYTRRLAQAQATLRGVERALLKELRGESRSPHPCHACGQTVIPNPVDLAELEERLKDAKAEEHSCLLYLQTHPDDSAIRAKLSDIAATLGRDDGVRTTWDRYRSTKVKIDMTRQKAEKLSDMGKDLISLGTEILRAAVEKFENNVNKFLPDNRKFIADVDIGRFGFWRDGELHTSLSGSEWAHLIVAMVSAVTEEGKLAIAAPKDIAWDADNLTRTMEALSDSKVQIILMSTVMPNEVAGWTIVRTEETRRATQ